MPAEKLPKRTGIYQINDRIEEFTFEVRCRCVDSVNCIPKYEIKPATQANWSFNIIDDVQPSPKNVAKAIIKWQEKRFSSKQIDLYSRAENCRNDIQKKYHEYVKRIKKKSNKKQQNTTAHQRIMQSLDEHLFTYTQEDNFRPSESEDDVCNESPCEVMYIYMDLKRDIMLAKMQWFPKSRLLCIYPDLQVDPASDPYYIEITKDARHLYSYSITNVSLARTPLYCNFNTHLHKLFPVKHYQHKLKRKQEFVLPPKRKTRFSILFKIQDLNGFGSSNVYVRYSVNIPQNCVLEEGVLEGCTHLVNQSMDYCSHIDHCCQFTFLCNETNDWNVCLYITFEIISIDSWERQRSEGCCFYAVNVSKPNQATVHLKCVKRIESFWNIIHRYFFGGIGNFVLQLLPAELSTRQNVKVFNFHNRYSTKSRNVGELLFKYECFVQRNLDTIPTLANHTRSMTLDDIVVAYRESRKRLKSML